MEPLAPTEEHQVIEEERVSAVLREVHRFKKEADERLRAVFGTRHAIDEMAVMFPSAGQALRWVSQAVRVPGVTLFNSATDQVQTRPIPSAYTAHYWFLTPPELPAGETQPWRIEAMYARSGSPLHDAHLKFMERDEVCIMHASFKCADEESYGVAVKSLRDNGYEAVQLCDSTYGRFSYWAPAEGVSGPAVYLKPRVNLRDTEDES